MLSTFEIPVTSCRNVLEPKQIKAVPEQIEALESRFAIRDVLASLPTGALERFKFIQCFVWQSFLPPPRLRAC